MYKIGLNGFRDKYKGCRFLYKLKQLRWELRYAWRRAWKGFDDQDIFNLNDQFIDRMIVLLTEYNKHNISLFVDPKSPKGELKYFTEEETRQVVEQMIWYFENCKQEVVGERLYGEDWFTKDVKVDESIYDEMLRCKNIAFKMLSDYFYQLWY
jgi:hypothetical protein